MSKRVTYKFSNMVINFGWTIMHATCTTL